MQTLGRCVKAVSIYLWALFSSRAYSASVLPNIATLSWNSFNLRTGQDKNKAALFFDCSSQERLITNPTWLSSLVFELIAIKVYETVISGNADSRASALRVVRYLNDLTTFPQRTSPRQTIESISLSQKKKKKEGMRIESK